MVIPNANALQSPRYKWTYPHLSNKGKRWGLTELEKLRYTIAAPRFSDLGPLRTHMYVVNYIYGLNYLMNMRHFSHSHFSF